MASVAEAEASVPAHAVLVAKAVAALAPRARSASRRFLSADLTFDSTHAAGVGTRDLCPSNQRIVSYRAGEFSIHVRLEHETMSHGQVLVGQLLRHAPAPFPVTEVPVLVLAGGKVVGRSLTSRFGEFQAEGLPPDPLGLCLLVEPERWIDISLGSLPEV